MNKNYNANKNFKNSKVIHHNSNNFIITTMHSKIWKFLIITNALCDIMILAYIYPLFIHIETIALPPSKGGTLIYALVE